MEFDDVLDAAAPGRVSRDADVMASYSVDWTRRWSGRPRAVVRPESAEQVADVLRACTQHGVAVTVQGGNTGLVGGAVPSDGSVVLSTRALRSHGPVSADGSVTVGAGVTLVELETLAAEAGYTAGLSLASGQSATVGGAASTNAGGARVLRYGSARHRISGLRAVLPSGDIVDRRTSLVKDNTGYDLTNLLIGSEGTLAVITDVTWKLVRPLTDHLVIAMSFPDVRAAVDALPTILQLPQIDAVEWAEGAAVSRVAEHSGTPTPLPAEGFWVFAEMGSSLVGAEPVLEALMSGGLDSSRIAIAESAAERRALWSFRERITESISTAGVPVKLDVGVPAERFEEFVGSITDAVHSVDIDAVPVLFGHFAESNIHVNILPGAGTFADDVAGALEDAVLELVLSHDGTISAEHGIGRAKRRWLIRQRGETQLAAMALLKNAWDPHRILNPGVLLD
ncbi:FAD-binding oxidoreductase [Rhodococcoides fascians]|uniref:FAD-binding oxidoreductase n=1 Tax=Rhodococcoides fascians TaxID=1828 RepID=UPI00056A8F97|nr:FAD-binding oxidoreductase [Rhodococcus fascians]